MNNSTSKSSICNNCGKQGFCLYEDVNAMAFCPTYIRKRVDVKKTLVSSPFKCLQKLHIQPTIKK